MTVTKLTLIVTKTQDASGLHFCEPIGETSQKFVSSKREQYNNYNGYKMFHVPNSTISDCPK